MTTGTPRKRGRPPGSPDRNGRANRVDVAIKRSAAWIEFSAEFGARLRRLREERDISAAELAEAIHASAVSVFAWERGRSAPTIPTLMAIAAALGCSLVDLLPDQAHHH